MAFRCSQQIRSKWNVLGHIKNKFREFHEIKKLVFQTRVGFKEPKKQ